MGTGFKNGAVVVDDAATSRVNLGIQASGYVANLGISYASSTFTVTSASGAPLSPSNPGFVTLREANGTIIVLPVEQDQSFVDASGASTIAGNEFGTVGSIAWGEDCPFYLYAVVNDARDHVQFMCCRIPTLNQSVTSASIGTPSSADADTVLSMFSFSDITTTEYDDNPCVCIGSFRMQKDASDDWTVSPFTVNDGVGHFLDNVFFNMPAGQNDTAAGKWFNQDSGTAPGFATTIYNYQIRRDGSIYCVFSATDCNAPGSGGAFLRLSTPMFITGTPGQSRTFVGAGKFQDASADTNFILYLRGTPSASQSFLLGTKNGSTTTGGTRHLRRQDIDTGDSLFYTFTYYPYLPQP